MFGIKTSQKGIDVKTALDKGLVFDSQYDTIKSRSDLIFSFSNVTHPHSLGFVPAFLTYYNYGTYWRHPDPETSSYYCNKTNYIDTGTGKTFLLFNQVDTSNNVMTLNKSATMRISKSQKDVKSTMVKDIMFNADLEHFMIMNSLNLTLTYSALDPQVLSNTFTSTKVAHGLSYIPAFLGTITWESNSYSMLDPLDKFMAQTAQKTAYICVDATNVWLQVDIGFNANAYLGYIDPVYTNGDTVTAIVKVFNKELS